MLPLSRIIYLSVAPSTTLIGPLPTDFSYTPPRLFNLKFEKKIVRPYRSKRVHDESPKKASNSESSKTSLMLLHELKPSIEYKLVRQSGPSHRPVFTMAVELNGQIFEGTAQTKKEAKQAAAEKALRFFSSKNGAINELGSKSYAIKQEATSLPQFADHTAKIIEEKFRQLTENNSRLQRRKVLSGIVLIRNQNLDSSEIICLTTGTKTLPSKQRIANGHSLHDCHAEIIARRCLIRYCYQQLKLLLDGEIEQSIFERIEQTNRFHLKENLDFHLYISMIPCGDCRLFSFDENEYTNQSIKKSRNLLRKKLEVADGTIPSLNIDLFENEQLLTMSCSDKLCRWNFIGLQGALLSVLIDPIYYTNIIIGSAYSHEQMCRALYSRIENLDTLPSPYVLRRPIIANISNPDMRSTVRGPNHGLIWNCIDQKLEIIDTLTGLTITRETSTLSKVALFRQWIELMTRMKFGTVPTIYSDAKQLAVVYQQAKMMVNQAFANNNLGQWISKSSEEDAFDISIL